MATGSQRDYGSRWERMLPARGRDLYYQAKARRIESEHLQEFQRFYAALADKKDIFYMFFTSGLLQWASRAAAFAPPDVNLVLLGSDLQAEEIVWIRDNVHRPFHSIRLRMDDRAVWEFLFETNRHSFGWVDVDCFVLEPKLFAEMSCIERGTVGNTVWSYKAPGGADILSTFCCFLDVEAIRAVQAEVDVSPDAYSHELIRRPGSGYAWTKLLTSAHTAWLRKVLPADGSGRPVYPNGDGYFDTLQVYQLIANALGYPVRRVRSLTLRQQISSDEIVHIGKVSYFRRYRSRTEPEFRNLYMLLLQADFVLLSEMQGHLPRQYDELRQATRAELEALGLPVDPERLKQVIAREMGRLGASESSIRRVLSGPCVPPSGDDFAIHLATST